MQRREVDGVVLAARGASAGGAVLVEQDLTREYAARRIDDLGIERAITLLPEPDSPTTQVVRPE
jgi:hypothetical protein